MQQRESTPFWPTAVKGLACAWESELPAVQVWAYVLEFVDEPAAEDTVFEDKGVKVVIDGKSLQFLDGTQLDFVKEGLNEGFKFTNPNVKDECGCGESFNV